MDFALESDQQQRGDLPRLDPVHGGVKYCLTFIQ